MAELLIGAAIALVSSVVTSFIVHLFESKRNVQARVWQLEDRERNHFLEITKKRIEMIEVALEQFSAAAMDVVSNEVNYLVSVHDISREEFFKLLSSEDEALIISNLEILKSQDPEGFDEFSSDFEKWATRKLTDSKKITSALSEIKRILPYIASIDQGHLTQSVAGMMKLLAVEKSYFSQLSENIVNKEGINKEKEMERLSGFITEINICHAEIIKQLDNMRIAD